MNIFEAEITCDCPIAPFKSLWPFNPSSQGIYPRRAFPPSSQHQATVISSQASMKVARFVWRNWNPPNGCCVTWSRIPFITPHQLVDILHVFFLELPLSLWSNRPFFWVVRIAKLATIVLIQREVGSAWSTRWEQVQRPKWSRMPHDTKYIFTHTTYDANNTCSRRLSQQMHWEQNVQCNR